MSENEIYTANQVELIVTAATKTIVQLLNLDNK